MAVAELTRAEHALGLDEVAGAGAAVRVDVHDASRLEWSVSVPLPEGAPLAYTIDVELEIPSHALARHAPWDQLQSFTRLDGAELTGGIADPVTIDGLRRSALGLASQLSRVSDGIARHCVLAGSLFAMAPRSDLEEGLLLWLEAARTTVTDARARLCIPVRGEAVELARERVLVDEYASVRLLEVLAAAERSLAQLLESKSAHLDSMRAAITAAEESVARALAGELDHRRACRYVEADPRSPEALERYLDRSSQLKKHFQEVLFLEPELVQVADRVRHVAAALAAILASTWAFVWQVVLAGRTRSTESRVGWGLVLFAAMGGLVYAAKDRIKEVGKQWISGNVHRFYAQRVSRYRAPAKRLARRDVIVSARESCDESVRARPDPLNPESGAALPVTIIRYAHKGRVFPQMELTRQGVRRIKHVFRYDLSPLFARLDDAVKHVPVLDHETRRVRFAAATRSYRVPVRVSVRCAGAETDERATLVLTKRGLERLERALLEEGASVVGWFGGRSC